ncbi:MAG: hypothetical protein IAE94_01140 [Chthoniobacterales bacterium]|nr:hypothetical protein [Chthoniobacterales bacterium]
MKKYLPTLLVIGIAITAATTRIHAADPILDIQADSGGVLADSSPQKREVRLSGVSSAASPDMGFEINTRNNLTIPYDGNDPLFSTGSLTWIMRCKFLTPENLPSGFLFLGRYNHETDQRVAGFLLAMDPLSAPSFLISTDGTAASTFGIVGREPVPIDKWMTVAVVFDTAMSMSLFLIDDEGNVIASHVLSKNSREIPERLLNADVPFTLNAPVEVGLIVSRIRCWNEALNLDQILQIVSKR